MATAFPKEADLTAVRHFGFENELGVPRAHYDMQRGLNEADAMVQKTGVLDSVGYDGGGREFRTLPVNVNALLRQKRVHKKVCAYWDALKTETNTQDDAGTHIHISVLNKDHVNMERNAIAIATAFFPQFVKICGRNTTWARRHHCNSVEEIEQAMRERKADNGRRVFYMKGSMLAPTSHQTLEFRGPKSSNDKDEMLAWAEFLENVVKAANRKSVHGLKFEDLIKTPRVAAYVKSMKLSRKFNKYDLAKTLDENQLQ